MTGKGRHLGLRRRGRKFTTHTAGDLVTTEAIVTYLHAPITADMLDLPIFPNVRAASGRPERVSKLATMALLDEAIKAGLANSEAALKDSMSEEQRNFGVGFTTREVQFVVPRRYRLDVSKAPLADVIKAAWEMRTQLEKEGMKGFALFPECAMKAGYITVDKLMITRLYRCLYPKSYSKPSTKKPKGTVKIPVEEVARDNFEEIFDGLFDMDKVRGLRNIKKKRDESQEIQWEKNQASHYHFRYSLQTDGVGVALSFGRFYRCVQQKKPKKGAKVNKEDKKEDKKEAIRYCKCVSLHLKSLSCCCLFCLPHKQTA